MADKVLKEDGNKDAESGKPVQLDEKQGEEPGTEQEQPGRPQPRQPDR